MGAPISACDAVSAFHVHGIDAEGKVLIRHQLKRRYLLAFFAPTVRMMKALRSFWPLLSSSCDPSGGRRDHPTVGRYYFRRSGPAYA